jgi:replication factor A1
MANKRFDKGDHVITFDENSVIEPAEPDAEIPGVKYVFVTIADIIDRHAIGTTVDVKAIICQVRDPFLVTIKRTNEEKPKRDLVLWDDSGPEGSSFIEVCMWGQTAHDNFEIGAVIYGKDFRISEFQGAKSMNAGGAYELNPDSPQAFALRRKFEEKQPNYIAGNQVRSAASSSTAHHETIQECIAADVDLAPPAGPGQKPDPRSSNRHVVIATLTQIPNDRTPFYPACPELVERSTQGATQQTADAPKRLCNKKVSPDAEVWRCQAGHTCQRPNYRYLLQKVQVLDHTGSLDVSLFDEGGKTVMGCDAEELAAVWDDPTRDIEKDQRLSKPAWKRYVFRLKSAREVWQEEMRTKSTVEDASPLDFVKESNRMLADIKAALQQPVQQPAVMGMMA